MTEAQIQIDIVKMLKPLEEAGKLLYFAVPNGGKRRKREAAQMKNQGVRAGVPDLFIITDQGFEGWEIKTPEGETDSEQDRWEALLESFRVPYRVIRSVEDAVEALRRVQIERAA